MPQYTCIWAIDVEADSVQDAAEAAEAFMRERVHSCWQVAYQKTYEGRIAHAPSVFVEVEIDVKTGRVIDVTYASDEN